MIIFLQIWPAKCMHRIPARCRKFNIYLWCRMKGKNKQKPLESQCPGSRLHGGRRMWREFKKCFSITGDFAGKKYSVVMKRTLFSKKNKCALWQRGFHEQSCGMHDGQYWLMARSEIMWPDAYMKNYIFETLVTQTPLLTKTTPQVRSVTCTHDTWHMTVWRSVTWLWQHMTPSHRFLHCPCPSPAANLRQAVVLCCPDM